MINITIYKHSGLYKGFRVSGHSGYADSGNDIICAAVSALAINTVNSIEAFTDEKFSEASNEEEGLIEIGFKNYTGREATLLMDSFCLGVEGVREGAEKFIKIVYREV